VKVSGLSSAPAGDPTAQAELADELGCLLPRVRRLMWNAAHARLEAGGDSMFSWQLLGHVVRNDGANQTELARLTAQHPAGVSRTLEELEARALVRRERDPKDRRRVLVRATPAGAAHFAAVRPEVVLAVQQVLGPLTGDEQELLRALVVKLLAGAGEEL
jgi:DNA-binding MarR family transcriptional regulator